MAGVRCSCISEGRQVFLSSSHLFLRSLAYGGLPDGRGGWQMKTCQRIEALRLRKLALILVLTEWVGQDSSDSDCACPAAIAFGLHSPFGLPPDG